NISRVWFQGESRVPLHSYYNTMVHVLNTRKYEVLPLLALLLLHVYYWRHKQFEFGFQFEQKVRKSDEPRCIVLFAGIIGNAKSDIRRGFTSGYRGNNVIIAGWEWSWCCLGRKLKW